MKNKVMHFIFELIDSLQNWREEHDICEVCKVSTAESKCSEGCGKRICYGCESFYYEDATICVECEKSITPEEREADRKRMKEAMAGVDWEEDANG